MTRTPVASFRFTPDELDRWRRRAEMEGVSLTEWIRRRCDGRLVTEVTETTEVVTELDIELDIDVCRHPRSARESKGYATFCSRDKGGCGARL